MSRHGMLAIVACVLWASCLVRSDTVGATNPSPVTIYSVCLRPPRIDAPRQVKLRSFSTNDVNLRGYSLHDSTNCFYRFEQDVFLKARGWLILRFHPGKGDGSGFYRDKDSHCVTMIDVTNTTPFSRVAVPDIGTASVWSNRLDGEAFCQRMVDRLSVDQFDYLSRLVDDMRARQGVTNPSKTVMMANFKGSWYLNDDEVVLVDAEGRIVSYVGWTSHWARDRWSQTAWGKAACAAGILTQRYFLRAFPDNSIFETPHFTLERWGGGSAGFQRVPYEMPDETQWKDPVQTMDVDVDTSEPMITVSVGVRSSYDPWWLDLEFSGTPDFKTVVCYRRLTLPSLRGFSVPAHPVSFRAKVEPAEVDALRKYETWFYRARRVFDDGTSSAWTEGMKMGLRDRWASLSVVGSETNLAVDAGTPVTGTVPESGQ